MANIYVVGIKGGSASLGTIPARIDVATDKGIVRWVSGQLIYVVSGQQDGWNYEWDLQVTSGHAGAFWGWPSGVDVEQFSHDIDFPNGIKMNVHAASGHTYFNGLVATTFAR